MKKQTLALSLAVLAVTFGAPSLRAETTIKLAVVDMQKALEAVEAGRAAKAELEKDFAKRQKKVSEDENELKKMNEDFQKQSLVMNEAARSKKQAELQKKLMEYQQAAMASQNEIQRRQAELTEPIIKALADTVGDLAKKQGYTLVLEKSRMGVLYAQDNNDLTDELVKTFNSSYKKKK